MTEEEKTEIEKEFDRITERAIRQLKKEKEFNDFINSLAAKMIHIGKRCNKEVGIEISVEESFILAIEELKIGRRL